METAARKIIFTPLFQRKLRVIVPQLKISSSAGVLIAPALLSSRGEDFVFELHLSQTDVPLELQVNAGNRSYTTKDCLTVSGEINGEIPFVCDDVFPPSQHSTRSRGTSTVTLSSHHLQLTPEGTELNTFAEVSRMLGGKSEKPDDEWPGFSAHLIFHGPALLMPNAGTKTVSENDFVGSVTNSTLDTHQFQGNGYKGALVEKNKELHLHVLGDKLSSGEVKIEDATAIIESIANAVGFCFGFNPWPVYREIRVNHIIVERWICPQFELPTTYLAPISNSLWFHLQSNPEDPIHTIIPCVADGLRNLSARQRERLLNLLWHARCTSASNVPESTRLLTICAVLDGMTKLITDSEPSDRPATDATWKAANELLGLSWEKWTASIFEIWGKHRHRLSHGWLWVEDESEPNDFFSDYPKLGCAFHLMAARLCGYSGCVMSDPFKNKKTRISDIMKGQF